ncbi:MAG: hypothetical protein LE169_05845 [Endomicrobium sp.]|nr:hypothetical protein [Endomicrobium sp.]
MQKIPSFLQIFSEKNTISKAEKKETELFGHKSYRAGKESDDFFKERFKRKKQTLITNFNNSSKLGDSLEKRCGVQLENKDGMLRLIEKLEKNRENMLEIILAFCGGKGDDETKELINNRTERA